MAKTISEVGHTKNVVNLDTGIDILLEMGELFNPGNEDISIASLQVVNAKLQDNHEKLKEMTPLFKLAVAERVMLYAPMNKLATRFLNAFKAFEFGDQIDAGMISLNKKLRGQRIVKLKKKKVEEEETETISTAQTSYDNKAETFDEMIKYAKAVTAYKPNEEDMKTANLADYHKEIMKANKKNSTLSAAIITVRKNRDEILYDDEKNVIERMRTLKKYLKSLKGAEEYYKRIVKLQFKSKAP